VILNSVFIKGVIIMHNMRHCDRVILGDHPGSSSEWAFRWLDISDQLMFFKEVDHAVEKLLWKCKQLAIDCFLWVLKFNAADRGIKVNPVPVPGR